MIVVCPSVTPWPYGSVSAVIGSSVGIARHLSPPFNQTVIVSPLCVATAAVVRNALQNARSVSALVLTKKPGAKIRVAYLDQSGASQTASVTLGSGPAQ